MQLDVSLVVSFKTEVGEVWRGGASLLLKNFHAPVGKTRIVSFKYRITRRLQKSKQNVSAHASF